MYCGRSEKFLASTYISLFLFAGKIQVAEETKVDAVLSCIYHWFTSIRRDEAKGGNMEVLEVSE